MPMGSMYPHRKSSYKKKAVLVEKPPSAKKLISNVAKRVKKIENQFEKKYYNSGYTTTMTAAGDVVTLTGIAQGDTASSRDGNDITVRSIRVNGYVSLRADSAVALNCPPQLYRMIVFQDRQQVADTEPAVTDVLLTADLSSNYNYPNVKDRFKILYDKKFKLQVQAPCANATAQVAQDINGHDKWFFPSMKHLTYNGTTAADLQKGHVYMILITDALQALGASNNSVVIPALNWQVAFTDN